MNDDFAQLIRSLSKEEILARLPTQAVKFFTENPPLFQAWRLKYENPSKAQSVQHAYFMTMPPDEQYRLVFEISEMHRAIGSLEAAFTVVKQHKADSMLDDARRYVRYGVNVHLTSGQYNRLLLLIADNIVAKRIAMQATTDRQQISQILAEIETNKVLFDSLNEQFAKYYPALLASVSGRAP